MNHAETGRSADARALEEKLAEIKAERDYYRSIAEQTGKKTLGDIHDLSRIINNLRQTEELLRKSQEELEERVIVRTADLYHSNAQLQKEVAERQLAQEILQKSQRSLQAVVDSIDAVVYVADIETHEILLINSYTRRECGDVQGMKCWQVLQKGQAGPCSFCSNRRLDGDGGLPRDAYVWEFQNTLNGRWYECRDKAIRWIDGRIVRLEIAADITERKKVDEALKQSEEKYKALSESTSDWIWEIDRDGVYVYSSPNVREMLGYAPEEVVGKKPFDFMLPDESARILPEFISVAAAQKAFYNLENANVHKDGHTVILESSGVPIIDRQGVFCGYRGIDRDITDRKRMEESISCEKALLARVMETSPIGILTWDAAGRIRLANLQAEKIFGLSRDRITGHAFDAHPWRITDLAGNPFPDEDLPLSRVIATHQPVYDVQYALEWPEGKRVLLSINAAPLFTEAGQFDGVIESISDITDQKQMEEELLRIQKLESVGLLAGGIAHDFNNLLQGMMGSIELAKSYLLENEPEKIAPLLDQASAVARAASELSYRFLTFSKGGEPVKRLLPIERIIGKSEGLSLSGSNISCHYALTADLPSLEIDEGQMLQVFNNLFINAKEAMPGGGKIRIYAQNHEISEGNGVPLKPGRYVKISVQDTGIGIRPENLTRVFDPYFSVKGLGAKAGTGLGLAICHSIIRKHNGHIGVESETGKGTTFHIYLPVTHSVLPEEERKPKAPPRAVARMRILVMDDDEMVRNLIGRMIEHLGHEVAYARNGEEAVLLFRENRESGTELFDIVILDLTVRGGIGGEITMGMLLEIDPKVKAVISSGYADDPIMQNFREYGFADAMAKPYRIEQLQELIAELSCI